MLPSNIRRIAFLPYAKDSFYVAAIILFPYLCFVLNDKMFLPIHKEDLISSTAQINNSPLSFSNFIRFN